MQCGYSFFLRLISIGTLLIIVVSTFHNKSLAQASSPVCDYTIDLGTSKADGNGNFATVQPGDTVCIAAGLRNDLRLKNFHGTSNQPITFINSGGKVIIDADKNWVGLNIESSEHVRVTGTGISNKCGAQYSASEQDCGIEVFNATNAGIIHFGDTRYTEVDHVEVHDITGIGAGIRASENKADRRPSGWVQYDTKIHHSYIHDVDTEAFYIGTGGGLPLKGVEVAYNRLERLGWDGVQVRDAVEDVSVHHNYIHTTGFNRAKDPGQGGAGLIIGNDTTGEWFNNYIINTHRGIQILKAGQDIKVYNNIVIKSGEVFLNESDARDAGIRWLSGKAKIFNNTIVDSKTYGIRVSSGEGEGGAIYDNIVVGSGKEDIIQRQADVYNNLVGSIESIDFVDASLNNYQLLESSPAVDSASSTQNVLDFDFYNNSRPYGTKLDIGAYEFVGTTSDTSETEPNSPAVTDLMLINADTDEEISPLTDGDTIDLGMLPTQNLSVRADVQPSNVGSVIFSLDDNNNFQIENMPPYAIAGDQNDGRDYNSWTPSIGQHKLTVTPYTESNGEGTQGVALSVTFNVINSVPEPEPTPPATEPQLTIINMLGNEDIKLNCDGRRLVLERINKTLVRATCRPKK